MLKPEHVQNALGEIKNRIDEGINAVKHLELLKNTFHWNDVDELVPSILKVVEAQKEVVAKLEALYQRIQQSG